MASARRMAMRSRFAETFNLVVRTRGYWRSLPFSLFVGHNGLLFVDGMSPVFYKEGRIDIGRRFVVRNRQTRSEIGAKENGELVIGDNVFVNQGCSIVAYHRISIGDNCLIGDFTSIMDTDSHELGPGLGVKTEAVEVGHNVYIGRNCILLPGVSVGDNSVIAAGSIVTKDVPPSCVVAGNPARQIRALPVEEGWVRH
jgi:maltose O-acetyltransferase